MAVQSPHSASSFASRIIRSQVPEVAIPEVPLTQLVLRRAAELGNKPALIDGPSGRTISYAQLADAVRRAAAGLAARGFSKGDVLAIYSPNVPEYAIAFHAAASLGGISTTVNPLYTPRELADQLRDSHASYLLTVPPFLDNARQAAQEVGTIREVFVFGQAEGATPFDDLLATDAEPSTVEIDH